ncbi:hypothetical protein TIFTF001_045402 [Ficus carica]|uniref:Uncharacterized protein n=1 Tax=Ficus carica TaxID=3494 RepID=A0AA87YWY7_FICCA|nr:hypothetical protein TIFTF001_045402 [Ficus carica]
MILTSYLQELPLLILSEYFSAKVTIWAFEAMLKLCEMMAKKLALNEKNKNGPRWFRWRKDCSDDVIDGLAKFLEGNVILCSAADSDERNDELRSSHISRDPVKILRSLPASSAHEQIIRYTTPMVCQRQHPMPTSPTSLDPATASRSFPAIPTHEQIRASTPRDGQTYGPTPTFSTPVGSQTHDAMPTASTPSLDSLMYYIDRRIGEHETYMKSMFVNHEAAIVQKMEENNKAIMKKIEFAMAMNKEACSGGMNVEFKRELSRGVDTRYNGVIISNANNIPHKTNE